MKALKSYLTGIKEAVLQPKMILTLWLINFLFASIVYFPISGLLKDFIGSSAVSQTLLKDWDNHVFFEWLIHKASSLQPVLILILIVMVLYALVSLFLKGGILSVFASRSGAAPRIQGSWTSRFFQGAGKYWWRFFRLFIYSLIFWAVFWVIMFLLSAAGRIISGGGIKEQTFFIWFWVEAAIGLFLIFLIWMILDYARIRIVVEDTGKAFLSLLKGAGFVFSHFGRTLALYYLLILTGALLFLVFGKLAGLILPHTSGSIWLAFGIGQVFIASRQWLKMSFQAGQLDLYLNAREERKTPPPPVESERKEKEEEEEEEPRFEKPSDETWNIPLEEESEVKRE